MEAVAYLDPVYWGGGANCIHIRNIEKKFIFSM